MGEQPASLETQNLSHLLPILAEGFCSRCKGLLESRLQNLNLNKHEGIDASNGQNSDKQEDFCSADTSNFWTPEKGSTYSTMSSTAVQTKSSSPASVTSGWNSAAAKVPIEKTVSVNGSSNGNVVGENKSRSPSDDSKRMSQVGKKKDFVCFENINGKQINVLQGLELHTRVFNDEEQKEIVEYVYSLQRMGQSGKLRDRTYTEPRKWMKGKGRATIQFGCCYNYAVDKHGNPPGIIRDEEVDPIPSLFKSMIKRMVRWHTLPPSCIPNSCIVNIYDEGDCIPPHIDHHDFVRPFCTISFLTESNILFGSNIKVVAPGEFSGPASIPLPVGSVLILKGNGADLAKHCVPAVLGKRISITFRKMDDSKLPFKFSPDPELQGIQPLGISQVSKSPLQQGPIVRNVQRHNGSPLHNFEVVRNARDDLVQFEENDFPPLGALSIANKTRSKKN